MASPLRLAANGFLAFATSLFALQGSPAHAQDPFALPTGLTSAAVDSAPAAPVPAEIEIDGVLKRRMVEVEGRGDAMSIDAAGARAAGLPVPDEITGKVSLSTLRLYRWSYNSLRQRLSVTLFKSAEGGNYHDFAQRRALDVSRRSIPALRLDYVLNANIGTASSSIAGLFGASVIKGGISATSSAQIAQNLNGNAMRAVRLDSFVRAAIPGTTAVATAGDFISKGSADQRPLRLLGVQLASDFGQRPDLVTQPLPSFKGQIAVPTSVDVLTGQNEFKLGKLEPGDFAIRNVPSGSGRGSMTVLMRDSLGRRVTQIVDFYNSESLLAPGLSSYALNAGFVRRRYGDHSNDYGALVASAFYRRGLSPFLTAGVSAESTPGLVNFGLKSDFTLGNIALAAVEVRGSRESEVGTGQFVSASLESISRRGSLRLGFTYPTAGYRDVASHLGDRPPAGRIFANIAFNLAKTLPIQASFVRQYDHQSAISAGSKGTPRHNDVLSIGTSFAPNKDTILTLNGGVQGGDRRSFFVSAGLSMKLGQNHRVTAAASSGFGSTLQSVGYDYDNVSKNGLRAQVSAERLEGEVRLAGLANLQRRWGSLQSSVVATPSGIQGQFTATGAIVVASGGIHAADNSSSGFLVVRTDNVEGIPVTVDNRLVGKTNKRGRLFIPNMVANAAQRIEIDGKGLPADAIVNTSKQIVSVAARAVGVVDFDALYFRPVVLQIVDEANQPLAVGLSAIARPSNRETQVGFDGLVEFNTASKDSRLAVDTPAGVCIAQIPADLADRIETSPLVCRMSDRIAEAETTTDGAPAEGKRYKKVARRD